MVRDKRYPYWYETHLHTSEGSACAKAGAAEMVQAYKRAGYTGIVVTDHFYYGNTAVSRSLSWEDWVEAFCKGYEHAKAEGGRIGLQVFFGWESCYQGTDFLIYGLDKEWLLAHPEIRDAEVQEQHQLVRQFGGMVIHAHPYREEYYIKRVALYPADVDGVEGLNASHSSPRSKHHRNPDYDTQAHTYAQKNNLPLTAGSDAHSTELLYGGVGFPASWKSIYDYIGAVMGYGDYVLLDLI